MKRFTMACAAMAELWEITHAFKEPWPMSYISLPGDEPLWDDDAWTF